MRKTILALALLAVSVAPAGAQPKAAVAAPPKAPAPAVAAVPFGKKEPPPVDQAAVDNAIAKGAEWLRGRLREGLPPINDAENLVHKGSTLNEIVLYTLIHAGVDRGDPDVIKLVNDIRGQPLCHTYVTALRVMAFELYDPAKLRPDLIQCADFLVNNQGKNGQWGYSQPLPYPPLPAVVFTQTSAAPNYITTGPRPAAAPAPPPVLGAGASAGPGKEAPREAAPGGAGDAPGGAAVVATAGGAGGSSTQTKKPPPRHALPRRGWGKPNDNSNTQYAVLGLRTCMGQGILPPPDCLSTAEKWMTEEQNEDGGWAYHEKRPHEPSYGSMTAGAVSTLSACIRAHGGVPTRDPRIQRGLQWLGQHLAFDTNPEKPIWPQYFYYWIYSVERAGSFAETEWFGNRPWYAEGATWLLANQREDGTWGLAHGGPQRVLDTCFAILFLRRATRHIAQQKVIYTQ